MMLDVKLSGKLIEVMRSDLLRPHPFAAERIGFVRAKTTTTYGDRRLLLLSGYEPIPDNQYIRDRKVGARIDRLAITRGSQLAFLGRESGEGVFHVHMHCSMGAPDMSFVDSHEIPPLVDTFRAVGRLGPHGILILSSDSLALWVWLPGDAVAVRPRQVSVIGNPLTIVNRETRL